FDLALVVVVLRFFSHNKFAAGRMKQMRGGENRKVAAFARSRGRQSALTLSNLRRLMAGARPRGKEVLRRLTSAATTVWPPRYGASLGLVIINLQKRQRISSVGRKREHAGIQATRSDRFHAAFREMMLHTAAREGLLPCVLP